MEEDRIAGLIEAVAARHDRDAFAALFRHFAPRLKAFSMRAGVDGTSAEEVAQEAMIAVWRRAETFDRARASASTWIFTIARNKRIDMFRRERRPEIDPEPAVDRVSEEAPADLALELVEAQRFLRRAIGDLPANQAEVLKKAYFEEKSHRIISQELDIPLGTIKSRARLGLARLKVLMAGWDA